MSHPKEDGMSRTEEGQQTTMTTASTQNPPPVGRGRWVGERVMYVEDVPDLTRHVMDALGMPADVLATGVEQSAIERALGDWLQAGEPDTDPTP